MNAKLNKLIKNKSFTGGELLDCYNQKIYVEIAPTITTRVSASNEIFVVVRGNYGNKDKEQR